LDIFMDLAIFSARIFTGNPTAPWAEAIGIKNGCIERVGSPRMVKAACDRHTRVLDLPNHLVTPGLVDAHCHFTQSGTNRHRMAPGSPDPTGGRFEHDPGSGQPTGLIPKGAGLAAPLLPEAAPAQRRRAVLAAQQQALKWGITGVHSCETLANWEILSALDEEGLLKLRVYHLLSFEELSQAASRLIRPGYGGKRLWFGHVNLFADGSPGADTAHLHRPCSDDATKCGIAAGSVHEIQQRILESYQLGWDVAVHAVGEQAVSHALTAIAGARSMVTGHRPTRDRIEHVSLFRCHDLIEFQRLRLTASVQPAFLSTDREIAQRRWGSRCRQSYAWRSLLDARIPLQFGSDAPVGPFSPIAGIHAAVTRQSASGLPPEGWYPEQCLTLAQALVGYTRMAAWTSRREARLGQLTPGRLADLTVFESDLFSTAPDYWRTTRVAMTVVGGEVVYEAGG
jgi:predicted amidohydrolase YtcJ